MIKRSYYTKMTPKLEISSLKGIIINSADVIEDHVSVSVFLSDSILDSKSRVSQILRQRNKTFYDSIQSKITIEKFNFYRVKSKDLKNIYNKVGVIRTKYPKSGFVEELIGTFSEPQKNFTYQRRYRDVFNVEKIDKTKTDKNEKLSEFSKIGMIDGASIYCFKDSEASNLVGSSFSYKVSVSYRSNIEKMLRDKIVELEKYTSHLKTLLTVSNYGTKYNKKTRTFQLDYFIELNNAYDYRVEKDLEDSYFYSKIESNRKREAPWIRIPSLFQELEKFLTSKETNAAKDIFLSINPVTGNIELIQSAINRIEKFLSTVKRTYNIKTGLNDVSAKESKRLMPKNNKKVTTDLSNIVKMALPSSSLRFIKINQSGTITKKQYITRARKEVSKFFKTSPAIRRDRLENLSLPLRQSLVDITNLFSFLTPEEIILKNRIKKLLKTTDDIFDPVFFSDFLVFLNKQDKLFHTPVQSITKLSLNIQSCLTVDDYVGVNSPFARSESDVVSTEIKQDTIRQKSNLDLINSSFIDFGKNLSINSFLPDNKNFRIDTDENRIRPLPISIKALMLSDQEGIVRFPFTQGSFDILKNPCTSQIIKINYLNIKKVECIVSFNQYQGYPILKSPVYELVSETLLSDREFLFCKMTDFQDPQLGISRGELKSKSDMFIIKE